MSLDSFHASSHPAHTAGASLGEVALVASGCTLCRLAEGRTQVVFGVGRPDADLLFVGEGPGQQEDLKGEPFVGRAGQLLTQLIEGIGLTRDHVYIANVVKCRPERNRNPEPDEVAACNPFLMAQIETIKPVVILTLGNFATQTLLGTKEGITKLRGKAYPYRSGVLVPTFHPAFLLRNPGESFKRMTWDDLKLARQEYDRLVAR